MKPAKASRLRGLAALLCSASAAFVASSVVPAVAHADEKEVCARASEDAQQLRTEGRPREAREKLLICVRDACPQIVRKDCTAWLGEVDTALPSVVIDARDGQGHDLVNVRVLLDGKAFADKLDGKAIAVNPGVHVFRFEIENAPAIEEKVVVHEGEKSRNLVVTFKTPSAEVATVPATAPPSAGTASVGTSTDPSNPPPAPAPKSHGPPIATYVLGGVALVAAGSYAYFGIKGKNDVYGLRKSCAPVCGEAQKDGASQELLAANVSFGVGVASFVAAATFWIVRGVMSSDTADPSKSPSASEGPANRASVASRLVPLVDVQSLPGGGAVVLGGRF